MLILRYDKPSSCKSSKVGQGLLTVTLWIPISVLRALLFWCYNKPIWSYNIEGSVHIIVQGSICFTANIASIFHIFCWILVITNIENWKESARKMFKHVHFGAAMMCWSSSLLQPSPTINCSLLLINPPHVPFLSSYY